MRLFASLCRMGTICLCSRCAYAVIPSYFILDMHSLKCLSEKNELFMSRVESPAWDFMRCCKKWKALDVRIISSPTGVIGSILRILGEKDRLGLCLQTVRFRYVSSVFIRILYGVGHEPNGNTYRSDLQICAIFKRKILLSTINLVHPKIPISSRRNSDINTVLSTCALTWLVHILLRHPPKGRGQPNTGSQNLVRTLDERQISKSYAWQHHQAVFNDRFS